MPVGVNPPPRGAIRNLGAMHRERDRRLGLMMDGSLPIGSLAVTGEPGWDAFFGSLHEKEAAAREQGMGFRASLGDIGRFDAPFQAGPSANALNARAGQMADENAVRQLAIKRAIDQERDAAIGDMQRQYQEHVLNSVGQPREEGSITTERIAPDGKRSFSIAPSGPDTRSDRQRMLDRLPGALRAAMDPTVSALEQRDRAQTEAERHNRAIETGQPGATLTDDAIDVAARRYNQTGVLPPLGMGDKGNRQRILSRAAEINAGADIASNAADYSTNKASLQKLQVQRDAIGAFEETAKKNMDVFLKTVDKVADTGSPLLNQPVRMVSGRLLGSENQAEYEAARAVLLPEIARIITNPNLTGVLSDSARHEVSSFNPETATLGQTIKVMKLLKQDMDNRTSSLDEAIATVRGRMSSGEKPKPDGAAPNAASLREKYKY